MVNDLTLQDFEVLQLRAAVVIVDDEVEVHTNCLGAHIEVGVSHTIAFPGAGGLHTGPAAECLGVAPGIEGKFCKLRSSGIVNEQAVTGELGKNNLFGFFGSVKKCAPAVCVHIVALAGGCSQSVENILVLDAALYTLLNIHEVEAVGKSLAVFEGRRVQIDAPLLADGSGVLQLICGLAHYICRVACKRAGNVYLVICLCGGGKDGFDENLVALSVKGRLLVVEDNLFHVATDQRKCECRKQEQIVKYLFHNHFVLIIASRDVAQDQG